MTGNRFRADEIDTSKPHSARMYDYFLGGKTHYAVDTLAAEQVEAVWPDVKPWTRANRSFMHRATRWLAREAGIRQFLDIGTGIPTEPNLHQVAQEIAPDSRVVYADNDPIVLAYAQALLLSTPEGRTAYIHADVTEPQGILAAEDLTDTLDLSQPIALSLNAIMHFIANEQKPYEIVRELVEPLASGSYLVLSHGGLDPRGGVSDAVTNLYRSSGIHVQGRTQEEVLPFFDGLELVDPGVVMPHRWKPDNEQARAESEAKDLWIFAGVARKP
ncbi:SAM-dependent methyltransferase [Streptomyces sp. NEAU-YJ-81]|uniref:SAM-dependent methyltransferase n=1 Tax=Streptomyces sp. NEAU-YJ-81 TaxID=2820288 RepID=UPI001ABD47D2|nr:SAM-dependent methyltransferase [Streptomyces sp. NEAU-YJ-81]MBO3674293.1 SAM-dependent methyltransferase [Streptomyces sp. NEAU-YJ-81]